MIRNRFVNLVGLAGAVALSGAAFADQNLNLSAMPNLLVIRTSVDAATEAEANPEAFFVDGATPTKVQDQATAEQAEQAVQQAQHMPVDTNAYQEEQVPQQVRDQIAQAEQQQQAEPVAQQGNKEKEKETKPSQKPMSLSASDLLVRRWRFFVPGGLGLNRGGFYGYGIPGYYGYGYRTNTYLGSYGIWNGNTAIVYRPSGFRYVRGVHAYYYYYNPYYWPMN